MSIGMQELELAIRRFTGIDGAIRLANVLGFADAVAAPVARDGWADDEVSSVVRLAGREGLEVLLIELRSEPVPKAAMRLARRIQNADPLQRHLVIATGPRHGGVAIGTVGLDGGARELLIDRLRPRLTDLETVFEMRAAPDEGGTSLSLRYARALDRSHVTGRFFHDVRAQRARIAHGWHGIPRTSSAERDQLALLMLCRLMFLYFLQGQGHLAGDGSYLVNLLRRWFQSPEHSPSRHADSPEADPPPLPSGTFYRSVLVPLFFGALNTRPHARGAAARALGALPYLNGGLFECTSLERRHASLDLPDSIVHALFTELLERYRFAPRDVADALVDGVPAPGIDPEMLGRVFEALMSEDLRGDTGTFFTPASVVDGLVQEALTSLLVAHAQIEEAAARDVVTTRGTPPGGLVRSRIVRFVRGARVLDPACGSGAFLLGVLSRVARIRAWLGDADEAEIRREFVANALHGVDVQHDAALLCALRLWLALTLPVAGGPVEPLPNLDRRIRQGDALLDPFDLTQPCEGASRLDFAVSRDPSVRRAVRALILPSRTYVHAEPAQKAVLQRELAEGEAALARVWMRALDRRLAYEQCRLEASREDRDLFGEPTPAALSADMLLTRVLTQRDEMARLESSLADSHSLPFFSFNVHFAESVMAGFDMIVSNPPWVRAHRWPSSVGRVVRSRYAVCRDPGWSFGARLAGAPAAALAQIDLSMLFLERSLSLLRPGGTLAMLLPAKLLRSLYGGAARRMLLLEASVVSIEDRSLDHRSVFRADAFTTAIVATRRTMDHRRRNGAAPAATPPGSITRTEESVIPVAAHGRAVVHPTSRMLSPEPLVRVRMIRRSGSPLEFPVPHSELPLFPGDDRSPWLLAPARVRGALRRMQQAGPPLGTQHGLRVRRGIFTGANDVLLLREARPRIGGLASIRAEGWSSSERGQDHRSRYEAVVEAHELRPVVRGSTIDAWGFETDRWVVWTYDAHGAAHPPPARLGAYLHKHRDRLEQRSGMRRDDPVGALFRVSPATLGHKVVWHDLARTLEAVAVPARLRNALGFEAEIVPINTVYFIATNAHAEAMLLAAYLNSLPVRAFARTVAERAKDARFRFFAWTVAAIPLPADWATCPAAGTLLDISARAHAAHAITAQDAAELDRLVAATYHLGAADVAALMEFDLWLNG